MTVLTRIDRGAVIEMVERDDALPSPTHAPAMRTPEGYLIVDAYISRDGLLRYSDGIESWWEYRPKEELERAAASWHRTPVTDDHPPTMVDGSTWRDVARGVVMDEPQIEQREDGRHYLRARLMVTDADLVAKISEGKTELSVGFRARVEATENGLAEDGTRADAVQLDLDGNHVASVDRGRAGPSVRVFLDGADVPSSRIEDMKNKKPDKQNKGDQVGSPTEMTPIVAPDGSEAMVPTWLAAHLAELEAAMASPPAPQEGDAVPEPEKSPEGSVPEPSENKDSMDHFRQRMQLERMAVRAGVSDDKIDSCDSNDDLRRAIAQTRAPGIKLDGLAGDELAGALHVVAQLDAIKGEKRDAPQPRWALPQPVPVAAAEQTKVDAACDGIVAKFAQSQGFAG